MKKITRFSSKTNGLLNFSDMYIPQYKLLYWGMYAILFMFSLIAVVPVIWTFLSGFKSVKEMYAVPPTIIPKEFHFENLKSLWNKADYLLYLKNSLILIIGCLVCDIGFNGIAGYVLSRIKPAGSKVIKTIIFWTMLLPGISMVPLYMTWVDLPILHINLIGSYVPIWLATGANAFNVLLFKNFFDSIPLSYLEAARLDGCSDLGIFARIILPLSKPIVMVVSIFSITHTWGNFMWPYMILGNTDKEPIAVMLYQMSSGSTLAKNELMLLMMLSIIPMFVMFLFFSKQIMGGLDIGGIKG